jgi:hypothetical protein
MNLSRAASAFLLASFILISSVTAQEALVQTGG